MTEDDTTAALERIREKLGRVQLLDKALTEFGARSHGYRLGLPLTQAELRSYEQRFGVVLPAHYRRFLVEVGHQGAGPYYGLFALDSEDPENPMAFGGDLTKPFKWTERFNPEEWDRSCGEDGVEWDEDGKFVGMFLPGALYLCHYGCALRFFLVVTGPCRGEVWHDWQANGDGIYPAVDAQGRRVGFLEWYEHWLDQSLARLEGVTEGHGQ